MTEATVTGHPSTETHSEHTAKPQDAGSHHSWAGDFAASCRGAAAAVGHAAAGVAHVVGDVAVGAAHEVAAHPLKAAAEVGTGVVLAAAAVELGVGVVAGAAVGAVALAGYGAYKGVEIASKESVGAIPGHMRHALEEAKHDAGDLIGAAATVYNGEKGQKGEEAAARLENVGRATVPFAAAAIGGAGGEIGQMALRGGARVLADILPALSLEPAYAYAGGSTMGGAIATMPGRVGGEQAALAAGTAGTTMHMSDSSRGGMSEYDRQQHFIEGKGAPGAIDAPPGPMTELGKALKNIDQVMKQGGVKGNFKFTDDGKGIITVEVTDGPLKGRTGLWEKGSPQFSFDMGKGKSPDFKIPE